MRTKGDIPFKGKGNKLKERERGGENSRDNVFVGMEDRRMRSEAGP